MKVHSIENIKKGDIYKPFLTVGIFDGIHKGHQYILNILKEEAIKNQGDTAVVTLWPHPRMVLYPEKEIKLLTTLPGKNATFSKKWH